MTQLSSLAKLWSDFQFKPNPEQRRAILHTEGPLYLPAGPGSGKTRVLLWRTVNLIACHGVAPERIFVATFTEKAARQLREGLRALLGAVTNITEQPYDVDRMYVGTVHSLCQRILSDRRFFPNRLAGRPPALLDELTQYFQLYRKSRWQSLIENLELGDEPMLSVNTLFGKKSRSRHECVMNCLALFNRLSEECLCPEDWQGKAFDMVDKETFEALLTCYERYCAALEEHPARTDFALARETRNLCVVGDDTQALYRFRGATVENFVQFPVRCSQHFEQTPEKIPLSTNYRSRAEIVNTYTDFIGWCDWSEQGAKGGRSAASPYGGDLFRVKEKVNFLLKMQISLSKRFPKLPENAERLGSVCRPISGKEEVPASTARYSARGQRLAHSEQYASR